MGGSVASAGDVNGDGYSDIVVGANGYSNGEVNEGAAFIYLGSNIGIDPNQTPWSIEGSQVGATRFGRPVASVGDVNSDGYGDVIVGAGATSKIRGGEVFIFHGSSSGLKSSYDLNIESDEAYASFGASVASAGDVNGDGYGDVIVGSSGFSNGEVSEGAAFVYLGSSTGLNSNEAWSVESNQASAQFGSSVAGIGDVNGDGYENIIVGAYLYDNGETDEGVVAIYDLTPPLAPFTSSGSYNITQHLFNARADGSTLIPACGLSDSRDSLKLQVKVIKYLPEFVIGGVRLEWEIRANGQAFDGVTTSTAITGSNFTQIITGLQAGTAYRWRVRMIVGRVAGPWLRVLNHDVQGCDIRTNTESDLVLTVSAPNEVGVNHEFDAVFSIVNTIGPDRTPSVVFNTDYYPNTLPILNAVADSGGSCKIQNLLDQNQSIVSSRASCTFPEISFGTTAKVTLRLKGTQKSVSHNLRATVTSRSYDPDTANNTVSSTVNILPTLGLSASKTAVTTAENDQIDYFTVQLTSPPDGNVFVKLFSRNGAEAQVFPIARLKFDATNWNLPLPVTIRGVRDTADADTVLKNYQITLTPTSDAPGSTDEKQLLKTGAVTIDGQNTDVPADTIINNGLSIPHARAPGYGADITGPDVRLTWDKVIHPKEGPVSFNVYLCTDSTLAPSSCKTINPVVQASLMPLWITAGAGGSGLLLIGFVSTRPRKRWMMVAGMLAIGFTLVSCSSGGGSDLPPSAPPAPDTMSTTVTGLATGTYYWRVEAFDPGDGGIPTVSSQVMIFTVSP